jgi:hypothetical protein
VITTASILSNFWDGLEENHEQAVFLVLVGFLGSFAFIRMSTRIIRSESVSWWPGNVESESGVHVHHLVFGIVTMMAAGTLAFVADGRTPYTEICALGFGIGVGLTIDEFALWVYLDDVYWSKEGRSSIDAALIAFGVIGLLILGVRPFEIDRDSIADLIATIVLTTLVLLTLFVSFLKRRIVPGITGVVIWPVAIYTTCRLGKPDSWWAKRFYNLRNPEKQTRSEQRFREDRRTERFKHKLRDLIGGEPEDVYNARIAERAAAKQKG